MIGTTVSHYEILEKLGEGGMGVVYKARDTRLERLVALKFLPADLSVTESVRQRFVQEARAASALNHPNIATVYDIGEAAGARSFIAMEYVEGATLRARLRESPIPIDEVKLLAIQIAEGLEAAHAKGIVHRDIKPDNLLLGRDGRVKIMDFGVAKLGGGSGITQVGSMVGTLAYMSPEQVLGEAVDHRSDLWAFGVVLYEMLARQLPFHPDREAAMIYEILNREPAPLEQHRPDTPAVLRGIIGHLLQKDPANRPGSASDVLARLRGTPVPAAAPPAKSIAVLYFENLSSERESDYFCAGITEDIITDLSKISELRVVSRSDVLPFRNKEVNARQVGEALRVSHILEGSLRKAGNRIRIAAQLVNTRDGYQVWGDRFDGVVEDIFDLQNEVSRRIAEALKVSLTDSERDSLARNPTDDLRAYDFYMRGREYLNRRGKKNTETAIRMFENALDIDARFSGAYAALGEACTYMYEWYDGRSLWLARSIEMNQAALVHDPESLEARFGIAMVYIHQQRLAEARKTLLAILESDPRNYPASLRLGLLAERTRDLDTALTCFQRAAELRPHDDDPWRFLAGLYRKLGNEDAAIEAALKVIEITSRKLEASLEDPFMLSRLGEAYARFSGKTEANAVLRRVFELEPDDGLVLYNCACAQALLGQEDEVLVTLRRAYDRGYRAIANAVHADNAFDAIRERPSFRALVAELDEARYSGSLS